MRASATRAGWRRGLTSALTENLPLKLAAAFFAVALWIGVRAEGTASAWIPVRVALTSNSGLELHSTDEPDLRALVVGPGRELLKLYTVQPVVRRVIRPGSEDRVTLDVRPADVDLPSGIDVRVRDVQPRTVTLQVSRTHRLSESGPAATPAAAEQAP